MRYYMSCISILGCVRVGKPRRVRGVNQSDGIQIDDHFADMFEIDRRPAPDHRLHLPQTPVARGRIHDQITGFEKFLHEVLYAQI